MFDFLKNNKKNLVPDIGKEDLQEDHSDEIADDIEKPYKGDNKKSRKEKKDSQFIQNSSLSGTIEQNNFKFEKLNARFEEMRSLLGGFNERLGNINQQIGEVRAMAINNEKSILKSTQGAEKVVDLVNEVKPEKIRADYQKMDLSVKSLEERIQENRNILDTLMNEIKDMRRKIGVFVGTDALLRLNEDVKKDLIELQKLGSKVKVNADKSEEIFVEIRKNFSSNQKLRDNVDNISTNLEELKKETEKIKVAVTNMIKTSDLSEYSKKINDGIRKNNIKISSLSQTSLEISKSNRKDIDSLLAKFRNFNLEDHEEELRSIVKLIDSLAGKVAMIENKIGVDSPDEISAYYSSPKLMKKNKDDFKNVTVRLSKG
jgi:methyl-accepting chemotaxis protein